MKPSDLRFPSTVQVATPASLGQHRNPPARALIQFCLTTEPEARCSVTVFDKLRPGITRPSFFLAGRPVTFFSLVRSKITAIFMYSSPCCPLGMARLFDSDPRAVFAMRSGRDTISGQSILRSDWAVMGRTNDPATTFPCSGTIGRESSIRSAGFTRRFRFANLRAAITSNHYCRLRSVHRTRPYSILQGYLIFNLAKPFLARAAALL